MRYGTMPDFSLFKHIDLTHSVGEYVNGSLLASCITNSFGDKMIYYRIYITTREGLSYFDTLGAEVYHEGSHPNFKEMTRTAIMLAKQNNIK